MTKTKQETKNNKLVELNDEELEKVYGGAKDPLTNKSTVDEVEEGTNVFAFDNINKVFRWGTVVKKFSSSIEVSFGGGVAFVDGEPKNLTPCSVRLEEFWLSPTNF